jgi:ferredoxin-NADP reductase
MSKPVQGMVTLKNKQLHNAKVMELDLVYTDPTDFTYLPGQYITLQLTETGFRPYSIASGVNKLPQIKLYIEVAHEGVGSNFFKSAPNGTQIKFIGPSGKLLLKKPLPDHLFFFATGTGIAPFLSIFEQLVKLNSAPKVTLYFGIRTEKDDFIKEKLEDLKTRLPNFTYEYFISKPENPSIPSRRVTKVFNQPLDLSGHYYICGHPNMIDEVKTKLLSSGVSPENIVLEEFTRTK